MTRSRDEIEMDLPFLVNGTLGVEERAEIEALLAEDELLAAERDALTAIRAEMQAEEVRSPGDFGLARLMRDVDREGTAPAETSTKVVAFRARSWMWQAVAAVAVIGLLGQGYYLRDTAVGPAGPAMQVRMAESAPGAGYVLAGAEEPGALVVAFAPGASEADIRGLLLDAELEIVAGPSALGFYRLDVLEGADLEAATAALQAAATIVESVENAQN